MKTPQEERIVTEVAVYFRATDTTKQMAKKVTATLPPYKTIKALPNDMFRQALNSEGLPLLEQFKTPVN